MVSSERDHITGPLRRLVPKGPSDRAVYSDKHGAYVGMGVKVGGSDMERQKAIPGSKNYN